MQSPQRLASRGKKIYLETTPAMKEKALEKAGPLKSKFCRCHPGDQLMGSSTTCKLQNYAGWSGGPIFVLARKYDFQRKSLLLLVLQRCHRRDGLELPMKGGGTHARGDGQIFHADRFTEPVSQIMDGLDDSSLMALRHCHVDDRVETADLHGKSQVDKSPAAPRLSEHHLHLPRPSSLSSAHRTPRPFIRLAR